MELTSPSQSNPKQSVITSSSQLSPKPSNDHGSSPKPSTDHGSTPKPSNDHGSSPKPSSDHGSSPKPSSDHGSSPKPSSDRAGQSKVMRTKQSKWLSQKVVMSRLEGHCDVVCSLDSDGKVLITGR